MGFFPYATKIFELIESTVNKNRLKLIRFSVAVLVLKLKRSVDINVIGNQIRII